MKESEIIEGNKLRVTDRSELRIIEIFMEYAEGYLSEIITWNDVMPVVDAGKLAELFHDTYERLAPQFGYTTREDTKVFNKESPNGKLMIAVCDEIMKAPIVDVNKSVTVDADKVAVGFAEWASWNFWKYNDNLKMWIDSELERAVSTPMLLTLYKQSPEFKNLTK